SNINVTAEFAIDTFTLTYTVGDNGTITGTLSQSVDYNTAGTTVTAVPNTGYKFVKWSDGVTTTSRTDSSIKGNINVSAEFVIDDPVEIDKLVDISIILKDKNNKVLENIECELHSTPKKSVSNSEGLLVFEDVEMGQHTLFIMGKDGVAIKTIAIEVVENSTPGVIKNNDGSLIVNLTNDTLDVVIDLELPDETVGELVKDTETESTPLPKTGSFGGDILGLLGLLLIVTGLLINKRSIQDRIKNEKSC
ncbi:InlB B-repeat-containing protein, partial [Clostridium sp. DL1XJH146]